MRRLAKEEDFEEVFAIYMHEEVVPYLGFDPMPLAQFRRHFQDLLRGGNLFVVEIGGKVASFYQITRQEGRAQHVATLSTFAVAPSMRGQGLAHAVIQEAIEHLHATGVRRVELTVETDNARALAFYAKMGFQREGTLRQAYKRATDAHYVDVFLMAHLRCFPTSS